MHVVGLTFHRVVDRNEEVVRVRGRVRRNVALDSTGEDVLDQGLLKGLHLEEAALGDSVGDLLGALLADQVGDPGVRHHHLDRSDPAAADAGEQALADHSLQDAGEDRANLLLLPRREELDHPADGLGGVDGVQRREDEVARLGGLERRLRRLRVAQLADQDRVGVLAENTAERLREVEGVEPDLALVDDAIAIGMEDLDRILDRDDVLVPRAVDVVDHRREARRLAGAGRTRDEDQAAVLIRQPTDARRQPELLEARDIAGNHAKRERDRAALSIDVDAEARQPVGGVGDVEVSGLVELLETLGHDARHRLDGGEQVLLSERRAVLEWRDGAVATQHRGLVQLQVDIARAEVDGAPEEGIQVHKGVAAGIGRFGAAL
jgi:hypothetical protein